MPRAGRRCRIKSAKGRDEGRHFGKAIIEIKRELMRLDGIERQVRMIGPPAQELAERRLVIGQYP